MPVAVENTPLTSGYAGLIQLCYPFERLTGEETLILFTGWSYGGTARPLTLTDLGYRSVSRSHDIEPRLFLRPSFPQTVRLISDVNEYFQQGRRVGDTPRDTHQCIFHDGMLLGQRHKPFARVLKLVGFLQYG